MQSQVPDKFDDILHTVGAFGVYQICSCIMLYFMPFLMVETIYMNFVSYSQDHWCKVEEIQDLPFELQVSYLFLQIKIT